MVREEICCAERGAARRAGEMRKMRTVLLLLGVPVLCFAKSLTLYLIL